MTRKVSGAVINFSLKAYPKLWICGSVDLWICGSVDLCGNVTRHPQRGKNNGIFVGVASFMPSFMLCLSSLLFLLWQYKLTSDWEDWCSSNEINVPNMQIAESEPRVESIHAYKPLHHTHILISSSSHHHPFLNFLFIFFRYRMIE